MRNSQAAAALAALALWSPVQAEEGISAKPAYRLFEGISDKVYDFTRRHVLGAVLPEQLTRSLKAAPLQDSTPLFERRLDANEARYVARLGATDPTTRQGPASEDQVRAWRSWAVREQASVVADAFTGTLMQRYQLELFGRASGEYVMDRRHWDPGFLAMAGFWSSALLYLNGMHARAGAGRLNLGIDLSPALRLQRALRGNGNADHLAAFELAYKDMPLTFSSQWGLSSGHLRGERVSLDYRLRF